jgi:hypothetical protein
MATNHSEFTLYLTDKDHEQVCVLPGGEIPAWALKSITNPYVLGADPDAKPHEHGGDGPPVPPQSGRGSSHEKWQEYAQAHGVDVEGLDRDGIIAACEEAGVPVE